MILNNTDIVKAIKDSSITLSILNEENQTEWLKKHVQGTSLDVPLGNDFYVYAGTGNPGNRAVSYNPALEPIDINGTDAQTIFQHRFIDGVKQKGIILPPSGRVLGRMLGTLTLANDITAKVYTRSSAGRWGLDMCLSAGWVDPGFDGILTFEMQNFSPRTLLLKPGVCYAQLVFYRLSNPCKLYKGYYNNSDVTSMLPKPLV